MVSFHSIACTMKEKCLCLTGPRTKLKFLIVKESSFEKLANTALEIENSRLPTGLAIDKAGHLVVADESGLQVFTLDGMFVTMFGGDVLSDPYGVSVLKDGRIIVTDGDKGRLLVFE